MVAVFGAPVAREDDPERALRAALAIRDWAIGRGRRRGADRGEHRRGARVARRASRQRRRVHRGRRREHGLATAVRGARQRDPRRRADAARDEPRDRLRRAPTRSSRRGRASRSPSGKRCRRARASASTCASTVERRSSAAPPSSTRWSSRSRAHSRSASRSSSRSSACPASARAGSSGSCSRRSAEATSSCTGGRDVRCRTDEGVSYWAIAEMVKAQAGILEDDTAEVVGEKLGRAVRDVVEVEPDWVEARLAPAGRRNRARCRSLQPRRVVHRLADVLRGAGGAQAARARLRRHPLGRRRPAGLHRSPRGLVEGCAAARAVHRAPGALRTPARLGWRKAERTHARPVAALERRLRPPCCRSSSRARCSQPRPSKRCSNVPAATRSTPSSSRASMSSAARWTTCRSRRECRA